MQKNFRAISRRSKLLNRRAKHVRNHPFVIPVLTFLVLFFVSAIAFISFNGQTVGAADSHVVHLHIAGKEQIVPTRAATVGELLQRLNVQLKQHDVVEPALDTPIESDNFSINVYKAQPVTIIDESGHKTTTMSAQPTPRLIAEKAGVQLYPEDKVETATEPPDENILEEGLVGQKVVIDRATPATINLYGTNIEIRTHADTVGEALKEKNIQPTEGDKIEPGLETPVASASNIFIVRYGTDIITVEETVAAPVETIEDPTMTAGATSVRQEGVAGRKVVTYEIEKKNDQEVSRKVIQEVEAVAPVKRVVVKGTKVIYSNPSANVELGRQIASEMGWGGEFNCIYSIFERESHWNHLARNRSSGAYGIPQALPGSKMGPGWESDPAVQIRWGIGYMVNRYGSPCKANSFWQVNHWY